MANFGGFAGRLTRGQPSLSPDQDVVRDNTTGLVWQAGFSEPMKAYADAEQYCARLELGGSRFRVPTQIEMATIVDFSGVAPTIDASAFPETSAEALWYQPWRGGLPEIVDFTHARVEPNPVARVRCIEVGSGAAMGKHWRSQRW